jgi:hypothetical protein
MKTTGVQLQGLQKVWLISVLKWRPQMSQLNGRLVGASAISRYQASERVSEVSRRATVACQTAKLFYRGPCYTSSVCRRQPQPQHRHRQRRHGTPPAARGLRATRHTPACATHHHHHHQHKSVAFHSKPAILEEERTPGRLSAAAPGREGSRARRPAAQSGVARRASAGSLRHCVGRERRG